MENLTLEGITKILNENAELRSFMKEAIMLPKHKVRELTRLVKRLKKYRGGK